MNKKQRYLIGGLIRHELEDGEHTFSLCIRCKENGSRTGVCWSCLLEELEENKSGKQIKVEGVDND